jgi:PAS domain S-box-containing protein
MRPDASAIAPRSELGRQLTWRLLMTAAVALAVVLTLSQALYDAALRRYAQSQVDNAVEFYKGRLLELDETWQHEAVSLKARLEFSRVLEDRSQRQDAVQSYFTVQGEERVFSHVLVFDRQGVRVASAGKPSTDLQAVRPKDVTLGAEWFFDASSQQLYRCFQLPVWLGREGQGRLQLLLPIDHALLHASAAYQSDLFVTWNKEVVASSLGSLGMGDYYRQPQAGLNADGVWVEQRILTWGTQQPFPELVVRQNVRSPLPVHNVWLYGLLVVGGLLGVIWWVLGRWMAQVAGRVAVLGEVSRQFTSESTLTPELQQQLQHAAGMAKDEIHEVALSLQNLAQTVQGREEELERHVATRTQELRVANARAEEVNHMLYTVLDTIPVRLFWKSRDLVYLGCNRLFAQDAGMATAQEVVGKSDFDLDWRDMAQQYQQDDRQVINSGLAKLSYEEPQTGPHGKIIWLRTSKVPLRDAAGEVVGVLGTYEDITERKKIEQALYEAKEAAESASHAKSEFLASMSHELRTPLNAILGFSQLFGMDPNLPHETRESAREIERAGQYLLSLVNDLIDLARVEVGKLELSLEPVPLGAVLDDSLAMVASLARQHGIAMQDEGGDSRQATVQADYVRLRQVMINLLSNAIKYNRKEGRVQVSCHQREGWVRISVSDTGAGIAADKQQRIFNAFDRLGAERGLIEGTGIGLVITKRIVEAMGGKVGFQSEVGLGSTFWVELPLGAVSAEAALQEVHKSVQGDGLQPAGNGSSSRPVVLYVEDNPMNQRLMHKIFARRPDLDLRDAATAEIGLELVRTLQPALILMDLNLPGMSGSDALRVLKDDPQTAHIPVIAVSANAMKGDRERGIRSGFQDYLTKPIHIPDLLAVLQRLLASVDGSGRSA